MTTALLTDRYELTMLQAALADGTAHRRSVFEVFTRHLPPGRRYGVVAGTGRVLEAVEGFRFAPAELDWLAAQRVVDDATLDYLAQYRFTGSISGYAEGEVFFPGSPLLQVESTFAEAVLLETVVLSVLNHDSAVASAASRMTSAAGDRPCLEMGSRRAHEEAAVAAARAAVVAGFAGTSNLEAGRRYGLRTIGTAAHAFTLLHDDEEAAFASQVAAMGPGTTLLVDTYDVRRGVERAVRAAGTGLGAVRLDSGDLPSQARAVREQLDSLGATGTKIVVSSDLDEHAIAALAAAPVDSYGVGTSVVTGSGAPTCGMVYKLVAREDRSGAMQAVAKTSAAKSGHLGRKTSARRVVAGEAAEEVVVGGTDPAVLAWRPEPDMRPLHEVFVQDGRLVPGWTGADGVERATRRHADSCAELPVTALRLSADDPAIPTVRVTL
ncbi:nicotinate phosphoribosyltransferase [Isoptericola sp. b441]|uniref:Nicotinate phosphoribosyltransferase n=1 Tax=Actinotalea lenta TaxID=3064654 RepID=A0ABT9DCT4_9CELL|nr:MULTISPECIES: nicotinate phosphoribosyltransferase [unclassified Isoptericola]MDO8107111.1 nicotinate phosphoribosyltransferase [Isoptericola sp. b441]MDO8121172.1 nicotinate phosphoribosyltransferase [Isoptericola sp. b490]